MKALAVKYRPSEFNEICGQQEVVEILKKQVEQQTFKNAYIFCGPSGCGKTTMARAFSSKINEGKGSPIEIDAASNSGVDNMRSVISLAQARSLDSVYKIFIIDECHSLTSQSWQALLKTIEEPPKYSIFILCTTEPDKIPPTIQNRCMLFRFGRIPSDTIAKRLQYVCEQEGFTNYQETCDYISKVCKGQMRDALSMLDKVSDYDTSLSLTIAQEILGNFTTESLFDITEGILFGDEKLVLKTIEDSFNKGYDTRVFIDQLINFMLDVTKYSFLKDLSLTKIPVYLTPRLENLIRCATMCKALKYCLDKLVEIKPVLKNDTNEKATLTVYLLDCINYMKEGNN